MAGSGFSEQASVTRAMLARAPSSSGARASQSSREIADVDALLDAIAHVCVLCVHELECRAGARRTKGTCWSRAGRRTDGDVLGKMHQCALSPPARLFVQTTWRRQHTELSWIMRTAQETPDSPSRTAWKNGVLSHPSHFALLQHTAQHLPKTIPGSRTTRADSVSYRPLSICLRPDSCELLVRRAAVIQFDDPGRFTLLYCFRFGGLLCATVRLYRLDGRCCGGSVLREELRFQRVAGTALILVRQ